MAKLTQCKTCSKEIASNAKSCPNCGAKNKKAIYKRPWFIVVAFLIIVLAIGGEDDGDSTTTDIGTVETVQETSQNQESQEVVVSTEETKEDVPTEYKSALKKAKTYSDMMHMSKSGIYDQLTSEYGEKFTAEAAQYAIDNLDADWKANALEKAKSYQEQMAMSPSAIYDQLTSEYGEQFTAEEAQYAIDNLE